MSEVAVRIEGVTKRFGEITALNELDLEVEEREIFGLVGSDGAGKTTTLRLICGLLKPDTGEISVAGIRVGDDPEQVRSRLGYLPQTFGLHGDLSIDENLRYFADLFSQDISALSDRRKELLDATELADFTDRMAGDLSGGMKQKSALICALIHRPEVLLLDEPTRGVDPSSRRDLWRIVYRLRADGVTVIVATSDANEAERCDRLGVIAQGSIVETGRPEELIERYTTRLIEVAVDRQRDARHSLQGMEGILAVSGTGDRLRVSLAEDGPDPDGVVEALEDEGYEVAEMSEVSPDLEDALLVLEARLLSDEDEPVGGDGDGDG